MKLYELAENYAEVQRMMDDPEADLDAVKDTLDALSEAFDEKVDQLASMYKDFVSDAAALDEESKKLKQRADNKKKRAEWIKGYIQAQMTSMNRKKVETARNIVTIPAPRASVELDDRFVEWAMTNAEDMLRYKQPEPDKTKILQALKDGVIMDHVALKYNTSTIIK